MHRFFIFCLAIAGSAAMLRADAWNKKTHLTVNEAIEIPGATLSPGKYVVKLVDSQSDRHIVQFTNDREDQVISTVLAIPNQRMKPTGDSEFTFYEGTQGQAPALRAWFYPGDNFGQQFAYPERKAMELSSVSGEKVPVAPQDLTPAEPKRQAEARTESTTTTRTQPATPAREQVERVDPTLMAQAQPKQQPPTPRERAATPPAQPKESTPKPSPGESDLPATASPAPLLGLMGVLSLGAALGLRRLSKRTLP
jgi:hypothetical protein